MGFLCFVCQAADSSFKQIKSITDPAVGTISADQPDFHRQFRNILCCFYGNKRTEQQMQQHHRPEQKFHPQHI